MDEELNFDYKCTSCDWKGTIDELFYHDEHGEGVCPECQSVVTLYE
jgi:hypothetical protein